MVFNETPGFGAWTWSDAVRSPAGFAGRSNSKSSFGWGDWCNRIDSWTVGIDPVQSFQLQPFLSFSGLTILNRFFPRREISGDFGDPWGPRAEFISLEHAQIKIYKDFQDFGRIFKISARFSKPRKDSRRIQSRPAVEMFCFFINNHWFYWFFMKSPDSVPGLEVMQCGAVLGLQDVQIQNHHSAEENDQIASIFGRSG